MNPATYFSIVQISYHPTFRLGGTPVTVSEKARYLNRAYAVPYTKYGRGTSEDYEYLTYLKGRYLRGEKNMAGLTFVGMEAFASSKGKVATEPKIAISDHGQIRFNKLAAAKFGEATHLQVGVDKDKRSIVFIPTNEERNKAGANSKIGRSEKNPGSCYVNMGGLLKAQFPEYNAMEAGNQVYPVTMYQIKTKSGTQEFVSVVIPASTPAAKPKVERKRKNKSEAGSNGMAKDTAVAQQTSDDGPETDDVEFE